MNIIIPWIGYEFMNHSALVDSIENSGIKVNTDMKYASTALKKIREQQYPLILISDVLAVGLENDKPSSLFENECDIDDYPEISALTIREIRKIPSYKDTSIIAVGCFLPQYTPKELYLKAGATAVFDSNEATNISDALETLIKKYLPETTSDDFLLALVDYSKRERRFGARLK